MNVNEKFTLWVISNILNLLCGCKYKIYNMTHIVKFVFTLTCTQKFNKLKIYYMKLQTVNLCFTILRLAYDGKGFYFIYLTLQTNINQCIMYSKLTISFSSNVEKNAFEKWLIEFVMVCRINWYHSHTFIQSVLLNVILHES